MSGLFTALLIGVWLERRINKLTKRVVELEAFIKTVCPEK